VNRENLKKMLIEDPNAFWQLIAAEGISEEIRSVIDEVDSELADSAPDMMLLQGITFSNEISLSEKSIEDIANQVGEIAPSLSKHDNLDLLAVSLALGFRGPISAALMCEAISELWAWQDSECDYDTTHIKYISEEIAKKDCYRNPARPQNLQVGHAYKTRSGGIWVAISEERPSTHFPSGAVILSGLREAMIFGDDLDAHLNFLRLPRKNTVEYWQSPANADVAEHEPIEDLGPCPVRRKKPTTHSITEATKIATLLKEANEPHTQAIDDAISAALKETE